MSASFDSRTASTLNGDQSSLPHSGEQPLRRVDAWDGAAFRRPAAVYRGAPFWSWNGRLDRGRLFRQLEAFVEMGMGGVHLHPRTGLTTPYLGDAFMGLVKDCVERCKELGLFAWLYDEDRWPSGFAGGLVTQDKSLRCRHLRLTRQRCQSGETRLCPVHHGPGQPLSERSFVAAWAMTFKDGLLASCRRIEHDGAVKDGEVPLYAYLEVAPRFSWFNDQQYVDTLNPAAMARFIEVTHERYAAVLGDDFGKTVPAIFTDEPLFLNMDRPAGAADDRDLFVAWTDDLPETYAARYGEDLLDRFPDVLFDRPNDAHAAARWRFRDHHTDRFVEAFAGQIGRWCDDHGILLTGHMMSEPTLGSQSMYVGEVMRSLRHFQLPGIDMLCDLQELITAKQAQSVARQCGRVGTMSELYGVTNWDFPFAGHLRQGNWQAALGVTLRVHHLAWYTMAGESKRDYPAAIGPQSPWWREYPAVEDHFARLAVALRTGKPCCRVGMLHPIESHWVAAGPVERSADRCEALEAGFEQSLRWLLEGLVDVDLVSEATLPELSPVSTEPVLAVGEMNYEVVVIPPVLSLRRSTLERLEAFAAAGGTVVLIGEVPRLVEGEPDPHIAEAARPWQRIALDRASLLASVGPWRDVELHCPGGERPAGVLHQLRDENDGGRILFVCRTDCDHDLNEAKLRLRGRWHVERCNTEDGTADEPGERWTADGWTETTVDLPVAGHVLLRLRPVAEPAPVKPEPRWRETTRLEDPVSVTLDEPNVLLLDQGRWRLDNGDWQPLAEILRIDNMARQAIGLRERNGVIAQPWCSPPAKPKHTVTVAYAINCECATGPVELALEDADLATIRLDGREVKRTVTGYWVDECLGTVALPALTRGQHELQVTWPIGEGCGLEACYLLGDFGVEVAGRHARLVAPVRELAFGDWTRQGLAFYGGSVTYHCQLCPPKEDWALRVPHFSASLIAVERQGQRLGRIIRSPHRLVLPPGSQVGGAPAQFDLIAFGNRFNTFGALHNCDRHWIYWGPDSWRTEGTAWTDGYQLRPMGILAAPMIEVSAG